MNDGNPVAKRFGVGKNVGGEEDGLAFVFELLHQVANFAAAHGIKAGHGFIEKDELGIVQNGLADAHALQHAFGKLAQLHALHVPQSDLLQNLLDALLALFGGNAGKLPVIFEQFVSGEIVVEIGLLGKKTDLRFDLRDRSIRGPGCAPIQRSGTPIP